jgi:hypothetical protein
MSRESHPVGGRITSFDRYATAAKVVTLGGMAKKRARARPRYHCPPKGLVGTVAKSAKADWTALKVVLGLLRCLCGREPSLVFPGDHWSPADLRHLPLEATHAAKSLLRWVQSPVAVLNELVFATMELEQYAYAERSKWPIAANRRTYIEEQKRRFSSSPASDSARRSDTEVTEVSVLDHLLGSPLTPRIVATVESLRPNQIRIADHNDALPWATASGVVTVRLLADGYSIGSIVRSFECGPAHTPVGPVEGELEDFFETGTEGVVWALSDDIHFGHDSLHFLEAGDHLVITDRTGRSVWTGVIDPDAEVGWRRYPKNPKYGQPVALGRWIHWTQRGFAPDEWAKYFIVGRGERFRGVLTKKRSVSGTTDNETP